MPPIESYYRDLLERYLQDQVTPAQARELFSFIKLLPEVADPLLEEAGGADYEAFAKSINRLDAETRDRLRNRLEKDLTEEAPVVPIRRSWLPKVAAAAILLIAAGTAWWYLQHRPQASSKTADILPGGNKATLTLANGSTMVLDSLQPGQLARQQGVLVIKRDSGLLAYEAAGGGNAAIEYNTLATPRGGQYHLKLADGTGVWLNAASSIRYPTAFSGNRREVEVTGEAYFEIARDKSRPFHVKTREADIEVLGTDFDVNGYDDEVALRATLLSGVIRVSHNGQSLLLNPGQQAMVDSGIALNATPDLEQVMAWKNGFFKFDKEDLATVLTQLSRWYAFDIKYAGPVPKRHFEGKLSRDLTLAQVLDVLSEMQLKFKIEGRTLLVQ